MLGHSVPQNYLQTLTGSIRLNGLLEGYLEDAGICRGPTDHMSHGRISL